MNPKGVRIEVLNTQEKHCTDCEYRYKQTNHCRLNCDIGKRLIKLGQLLGATEKGTRSYNKRKPHSKRKTKEEWDRICVKAAAMREDGMSYAAIARYFGIAEGKRVSEQVRKRGLI